MFKALLLEKDDAGFRAAVRDVDEAGLPEGDVTVRIEYSTINYKDALAITNKSPIVRSWPMVAGIDGAGTVLASTHPACQAGDAIVHNDDSAAAKDPRSCALKRLRSAAARR